MYSTTKEAVPELPSYSSLDVKTQGAQLRARFKAQNSDTILPFFKWLIPSKYLDPKKQERLSKVLACQGTEKDVDVLLDIRLVLEFLEQTSDQFPVNRPSTEPSA